MLAELTVAFRRLAKSPSFTATALLTFALCLGANIALFAVVNTVLIRPLPYPNPGQLVSVFNQYPKAGIDRGGVSVPQYLARTKGVAAFSDAACFLNWGYTLGGGGAPEHVESMIVTPSFFHVLGETAELGRTFTDEEAIQGRNDVLVISDALWRQRYASDPGVVGRKILLNGTSQMIVGVMPPDFSFGATKAQVWTPMAFSDDERNVERHENNRSMIARLRPGSTIGEAQSQVNALNLFLQEQGPFSKMAKDAGFRTSVVDLHDDLVNSTRTMLLLLQAGVLSLLVIGAVNLANLFMVRANVRSKEFAVRQVLGAGRHEIARLLVSETLVLSLMGAALGLGLGWLGLRGLEALGAERLPHFAPFALDLRVCAVAFASSILTGFLAAVPALLHGRRENLALGLSLDSRGGTTARSANRLRHGLIMAQFALAFTLLTGAALLGITFSKVLAVNPGFRPDNLLTGSVSLPWKHYEDAAQRNSFVDRLGRELRSLPGVTSVGFTTKLPFGGPSPGNGAFIIEGQPPLPGQSLVAHDYAGVSGDYFGALGVPLVSGRSLGEDDLVHSSPVCVVDENFARHYWPGKSALGHRISGGPGGMYTIVGVVGPTKQDDLADQRASGMVYFPYMIDAGARVTAVLRTVQAPQAAGPAFRGALLRVDRELALEDLKTMTSRIDDSLEARRSPLMLACIFSGVALVLAAIGIYGVLSYSVSQRRREIGVRMALGAQPRQILSQFLSIGLKLVVVGSLLGCIGGWLTGRAMVGLLYGVDGGNPAVYCAIALLLSLVAMAACLIPATRAARVPPMEVLRSE
ncbi:MAG TPA: ABC transporter permease [Opitutaceae bacterium]